MPFVVIPSEVEESLIVLPGLIQRTLHPDARPVQDVGVNHRRAHVFVA